ncbi:MAG: hypothetical protein ABI321_22210 [Polyangia bacterium]
MTTESQVRLHPPKVPFAGDLAIRVTRRLEPFLKPLLGLVWMVALFAVALNIGKGYPAVEVGAGGDFYPGHLYSAKLAYLAFALCIVGASRWLPAYRDSIAGVTGVALNVVAFRWQGAAVLVAWFLLGYYVLKYLPQHLALLIVVVGIVVGVKYLVPPARFWANNFYLALGGSRVAYYAFERRYIRKRDVSFMRAFGYCFTPLLFLGPDWVPYHSYHRQDPRAKTDRSAARLFYWAGIKLLLLALLVKLQHIVLPDPMHFDELITPWKIFVTLNSFIAGFWLRVAVSFDISAALTNLAGHPVPDANDAPFLGPTIFDFYRRHNVNALNFYRRVAILEVTRRFRGRASFILVILASTAIFVAHHAYLYGVLSPQKHFMDILIGLAPVGLFPMLLVGLWMESVYRRFWPLARWILLPTTIFTLAVGSLNVTSSWFGYGALGKAVSGNRIDCFLRSLFTGAHCTDPSYSLSWYHWVGVSLGISVTGTLLVLVLGKLFPSARAPIDTGAPPGAKPAGIEIL